VEEEEVVVVVVAAQFPGGELRWFLWFFSERCQWLCRFFLRQNQWFFERLLFFLCCLSRWFF
jgi:hypothetical protein